MKKTTVWLLVLLLLASFACSAPAESASLAGTWKTKLYGTDCYFVMKDDGNCLLVAANGQIRRARYEVSGATVTFIGSDNTADTWELSGGRLVSSTLQATAEKTKEKARLWVSMGGASMEDTIRSEDVLTVECCDASETARFSVVLLHFPNRGDTLFVKRIVAFPGETVELKDGVLYIDGTMYPEPYINDGYRAGNLNSFGPLTVPKGQFFVLGDHRNNSNDSRNMGPLDGDMILGVVTEINNVPYTVSK